jgi:hypothetical protein
LSQEISHSLLSGLLFSCLAGHRFAVLDPAFTIVSSDGLRTLAVPGSLHWRLAMKALYQLRAA